MAIISKYLIAAIGSVGFLGLSGCSLLMPQHTAPVNEEQLNQICQSLRHDIIMNANSNAPDHFTHEPEQLPQNPAEDATLYKQYYAHKCDQLEEQTVLTPQRVRVHGKPVVQ